MKLKLPSVLSSEIRPDLSFITLPARTNNNYRCLALYAINSVALLQLALPRLDGIPVAAPPDDAVAGSVTVVRKPEFGRLGVGSRVEAERTDMNAHPTGHLLSISGTRRPLSLAR